MYRDTILGRFAAMSALVGLCDTNLGRVRLSRSKALTKSGKPIPIYEAAATACRPMPAATVSGVAVTTRRLLRPMLQCLPGNGAGEKAGAFPGDLQSPAACTLEIDQLNRVPSRLRRDLAADLGHAVDTIIENHILPADARPRGVIGIDEKKINIGLGNLLVAGEP
jgi:hypothetical protein